MNKRRVSPWVVAMASLSFLAWPVACATRTHTSVRIYERSNAPVAEQPAQDDGEVVAEESGEYEMVSPGTMVVDP